MFNVFLLQLGPSRFHRRSYYRKKHEYLGNLLPKPKALFFAIFQMLTTFLHRTEEEAGIQNFCYKTLARCERPFVQLLLFFRQFLGTLLLLDTLCTRFMKKRRSSRSASAPLVRDASLVRVNRAC